MARKRGEYQKRKERQERFKDVYGILCIVLLIFVLGWLIINNAIVVHQIRNYNLKEYTGSYSYEQRRTYGKHHRHYYLIRLDNGDVLTVSKEMCDNQQILEESQSLTFQYTDKARTKLFFSAYSALSITSTDGEVSIVDLDTSHQGCVRSIWIFSILLFIFVLLFGGLWITYLYVVKKHK